LPIILNQNSFTHIIDFKNDEYDTSRATTVEEAESLRQDGWKKYDEIDGVHLYCKRK
jgi:hypothetical protein